MILIEGFLGAYINFILAIAPNDNSFIKLILETFDFVFQFANFGKKQIYTSMLISVVREYCTDINLIK